MKLTIPEKYTDLYLNVLAERKKMLEAKIQDFQKEIEEIDNYLNSLTNFPIFQENQHHYQRSKHPNYYSEWSWMQKISHYQEVIRRIFTSAEIITYILQQERNLNRSKVRSSISAALSNKTKRGSYIKYLDAITGAAYYGPSEWFINDKEPHPKYVPNILRRRLPDI